MFKKIMLVLFSIFIIIILLISNCNFPALDYNPKNIVFIPSSGKIGDTVTITGKDFIPVEDMKKYLIDSTDDNRGVFFNVSATYITDWDLKVAGAKVTKYIELTDDKIVCKVPEGAKTGKILVNVYSNLFHEFYHPSEATFTVLDASGDPIY